MSKKDRLDKKFQKQQELKKRDLIEEQEISENYSSKTVEKYLKKGKKNKARSREKGGIASFVVSVIMSLVFMFSGLYYGGVTIVGILMGYMEGVHTWVAVCFIVGVAAILIGIIFSFLRKHFVSFGFITVGTICYIRGALHILNTISNKLVNYDGAEKSISNLDKTYALHYLPILIIFVLSLVLFIIKLVKFIKKKKEIKEKRDNAPVKSIINT